MKAIRTVAGTFLAGAGCLSLSGCFIVNVPLRVVEGTARAGGKVASAARDSFSESEAKKEEKDRKQQLKDAEAEKKKQQEDIMRQQQQQQSGLLHGMQTPKEAPLPQNPQQQKQPQPQPPGSYYKPTITPGMLKSGEYQPPPPPQPAPDGGN